MSGSDNRCQQVAVLGATGIVGQSVLRLMHGHPVFKVCQLSASDKRVGRRFGDVCAWHFSCQKALAKHAEKKMLSAFDVTAPFVISCLPSSVAKVVEPFLAKKGLFVFSNASCFRMDPDVPLIIPEINALCSQKDVHQAWPGCIIKNPNCSVAGVALALAPLVQNGLEMEHISIVTLQSISGAGYPGLSAMDMISNTLPNIPGEWEKIAPEIQKILSVNGRDFSVPITTHVHRVPVTYGHVATVHILFKSPVGPCDVRNCYQEWNRVYPDLFVVHDQQDRPQARRDLLSDDMRVHVGQIRQGGHDRMVGITLLTHNLIRGAAGATIANMKMFLDIKDL